MIALAAHMLKELYTMTKWYLAPQSEVALTSENQSNKGLYITLIEIT